jgi:hypothetical protein
MATSFSGGGSRREPLTMGKQLVSFITQLLAHGQWFSPASSTTKTGRHEIDEILLKVVLKQQKSNQIKNQKC